MQAAQRGTALAPQLGGPAAAEAGSAWSPLAPCLPLYSDEPTMEAPPQPWASPGPSQAGDPFLWPLDNG